VWHLHQGTGDLSVAGGKVDIPDVCNSDPEVEDGKRAEYEVVELDSSLPDIMSFSEMMSFSVRTENVINSPV
jgi:hypothetical protein